MSRRVIPERSRVRGQLGELVLHLHQIQSAVVVSAAALRRQNCELDDDIANVLQRSVADKLLDQIERVEGTLQHLARIDSSPGTAQPPAHVPQGRRLGKRAATAPQSDSRYNGAGQQQ